MTRRRSPSLGIAAAAAVTLTLLATFLVSAASEDAPGTSVPPVSGGWQTIAYDGVGVLAPASWTRVDPESCDVATESWAPPGRGDCKAPLGIRFFPSAVFDAGTPPDVILRSDGGWAGYVREGGYAVVAHAARRDAVARMLDSVRLLG